MNSIKGVLAAINTCRSGNPNTFSSRLMSKFDKLLPVELTCIADAIQSKQIIHSIQGSLPYIENPSDRRKTSTLLSVWRAEYNEYFKTNMMLDVDLRPVALLLLSGVPHCYTDMAFDVLNSKGCVHRSGSDIYVTGVQPLGKDYDFTAYKVPHETASNLPAGIHDDLDSLPDVYTQEPSYTEYIGDGDLMAAIESINTICNYLICA